MRFIRCNGLRDFNCHSRSQSPIDSQYSKHATGEEGNILQFPVLVVSATTANKTFGPTDLTNTYSMCTDVLTTGLPTAPGKSTTAKGRTHKMHNNGDRFNSCQVIYSQFGLAIHQNDHQARRRFVEWAQNEIAVVPDFHKRILFSDEAHFWLNGYVNKQNCRIWSEANPQVYVETPLHPEKLTVWCALWAGGILLQKR
ncbi:hypothetical protein TNCV_3819911 [Trichonephila clavipes]|uniref:Transposase n=1 Tax=Trichonephila clavipes TaxID=2585209 RepID=A0A8X6R8M7_TRICX|nr:hypothetical protein TNCV_3819911 [Trichonephila clavipes]